MESRKRRRGRTATGRSHESLEIEKLSRSIWYGSRSCVWLIRKELIHHTWKVVKGMSLFNSDLIYDSHPPTYSYTVKYSTGGAIFTDVVHLKCSLYICSMIVYVKELMFLK